MPKLMGYVMEFSDVGKRELFEHECDPHSLTRTTTHKGGWFGLTMPHRPGWASGVDHTTSLKCCTLCYSKVSHATPIL